MCTVLRLVFLVLHWKKILTSRWHSMLLFSFLNRVIKVRGNNWELCNIYTEDELLPVPTSDGKRSMLIDIGKY